MDGDSWLSWIPIVFLLCMAAYFAVAETAATSVSRIRLKTRLDQGRPEGEEKPFTYRTILTAQFPRSSSARISSTSPPLRSQRCSLRAPGARAGVALGTIVCTIAVFFAGEMLPRASPSAAVNGAPLRRRRPCAFYAHFRAAGEGAFAHRRILLESRQGRAGDHRDRG